MRVLVQEYTRKVLFTKKQFKTNKMFVLISQTDKQAV